MGCTIVPPDIAVRTEIYPTTARTVPNTWIWIPVQVLGHFVGWISDSRHIYCTADLYPGTTWVGSHLLGSVDCIEVS